MRLIEDWEKDEDLTGEHVRPLVEAEVLAILEISGPLSTTELANAIYYGADKEIKQAIFDAIAWLKKHGRLDDCWAPGPARQYMGKTIYPPIWGPIQPGKRCPCCNQLKDKTL